MEPGESRFKITADDLRRYDWQARLAAAPEQECGSYCAPLLAIVKEYEGAKDDVGTRAHSLLYSVASFLPHNDSKGSSFGPMWSNIDGKRAIIPEDFVKADLDALRGILEEITLPEFRARVGDVLWENARDYKAAQIAVVAYLEAAAPDKNDEDWPNFVHRVARAGKIAAKIGYGKPLHTQVLDLIRATIAEFENQLSSGLFCHDLMIILLAHDTNGERRFAAIAERLAIEFAAQKNWNFSNRYWDLAEQWFHKAKDESEVMRCRVTSAEVLISQAEDGVAKSGYMFAAHWMGKGLEGLRQGKASPSRIKEVHLRFLEMERESTKETSPLNLDIDQIPGFRDSEKKTIEAAVAHVKGYPFEEALARLVHVTKPTDVVGVKAQLASQGNDLIWDKIMGSAAMDSAGKITDKVPATGHAESPEEEEVTARKRMIEHGRNVQWPIKVGWQIEPARQTMIGDHAVRRIDLIPLVMRNPFIPPGHEGIFIRGIQSGFHGDWLEAMHLLLPQFEAAIRFVLQGHNVVTSTLETGGTQKERDLNQLLWLQETEEYLPG